ncbi:MAG: carbohydrate binding domain-containing protein [Flavobacterium sp.]
MKKQIHFILIIFFLFQYHAAISQVIFYEDFGSSATRMTSPYVPQSGQDGGLTGGPFSHGSNFYKFAAIQNNYSGENLNTNIINNGYYAVVRPGNIYSNLPSGFPSGGYDWWVTNPGASPGAQNGLGSVLVVNGGPVLNQYYRRTVTLLPGKKYRLSAYVYASGSTNVSTRFEMQDAITENTIGTSNALNYGSPANRWVPFSWTFEVPTELCNNISPDGALVAISLRNAVAASGGNDFYVDDILLEEVTVPTVDTNLACNSFTLNCSDAATSVNLNSLYTGTLPNNVELVWFTTPDHQSGTEVANPAQVTTTGMYYAFSRSTVTGCYNTDFSTSSVSVVILPPCTAADADLGVAKTVSNPSPAIGSNVTFTITAINNGSANATGVAVTENIPSGYTVVSVTPSSGTTWAAPTWTVGNLANGASATLTVVATVNATGSYANTVTITGDQTDPTPGNNTATATLAICRAGTNQVNLSGSTLTN